MSKTILTSLCLSPSPSETPSLGFLVDQHTHLKGPLFDPSECGAILYMENPASPQSFPTILVALGEKTYRRSYLGCCIWS